MRSKTINKKIEELDRLGMSEKPIPYIGWYWREVDFDCKTYSFGVIPAGTHEFGSPRLSKPYIGFMENNKWGYGYVEADEKEWSEIKALILKAVKNSTPESIKAANDRIQALGEKVTP